MAQHTIDFSKSTDLKAIYEAGLRPWTARPGEEMRSLLITDQEVKIIFPGSRPFSLNVESASFPVLADYRLASVDFISEPCSLDEALAKAEEVCSAMGMGTNGLREAVQTYKTIGNRTPPPQYWNAPSIEKDGIRYDVTLRPLFALEKIIAQVYVVAEFYEAGKPMKFLTAPIKQPPGYEHVSMEPPPPGSSKKPGFNPAGYMLEDIKAGHNKKAELKVKPTYEPESSEQPSSSAWFVWFLVVIAASAGAVWLFLRKSSK